MENKNTQKAGDNSNQVQVGTALFIGITEERARAIIKEQCAPIIESYNEVAREIAQIRREKFENLFIPTLVKAELLESLKKPEIILAIQEAERQAIYTDDKKSYKLLSDLLLNRINGIGNKSISSYLKRATEVAIEVTDESLLALSIFFIMAKYHPTSWKIEKCLSHLNELYGILDLAKLSNDKNVIEQLDILKLIRISPIGRVNKMIDYYFKSYDGYSCVGIKFGSKQYDKAIEILQRVNLSKFDLIKHELNDEYVRLPLAWLNRFEYVSHYLDGTGGIDLSKDQIQAYQDVIKLYEKNDQVFNQNKIAFIEKWNNYHNLVRVRDWWDNNNQAFSITMVGNVLAYVYINSIKTNTNLNLPLLDLEKL